jgi:SET and MYND domain-containing protein
MCTPPCRHPPPPQGSGAGLDGGDGSGGPQQAADQQALYQLPPNPDEGPLDPTYVHLFLLKYMCPVAACFGTLAPLVPGRGPPDVFECNVCSATRTEAQFMQELEQGS